MMSPGRGEQPSITMERSNSRSSSILLGEDLSNDSTAKRRPSLILTSAPSDEPQGLAIGIESDQVAPSPRLRRSYPSSAGSPSTPQSPYFSTSPVGSPVLGSMPSPFLGSASPTLAPSPPMHSAPSSPRLASFTDPLGRLATGLVRRASNSSLNAAELPTSISRSSSPSRAPPSPTLNASPSLSPNLGSSAGNAGTAIRRTSFAAQAREKEKEKEREEKEREQKKREEKFRHTRGMSWSAKTADKKGQGNTKQWFAHPRRALLIVALVVGLVIVLNRRNGQGGASQDVKIHRPVASVGSRLQRPSRGGGGRAFIHPQVVSRQKPPSKSWITAPWRYIQSFVVSQPLKQPAPRIDSRNRKSSAVVTNKTNQDKAEKRRSVFVSAPNVKFVDHEALPPPVEHSDEPERDTLVLYRILGNDLPPRHSPGQTLRNLRFLLQHESDFSVLPPLGPHGVHHSHLYGSGTKAKEAHSQMGGLRVDKYFVLNRISEPEMVKAIIGLLHLYSVPDSRILIIPFDWNEYQLREFRWDGGVDRAFGWGIGSGPAYKPKFGQDKWRAVTTEEALENEVQRMADLLEEADSDEAKALQAKHRKSQTLARLRALDFTYHEKNLYAMNNVSYFRAVL